MRSRRKWRCIWLLFLGILLLQLLSGIYTYVYGGERKMPQMDAKAIAWTGVHYSQNSMCFGDCYHYNIFWDDDSKAMLYECDFTASQEPAGKEQRCTLDNAAVLPAELQKLNDFIKSLPLEKPQPQRLDPDLIILDETTKSFEVVYGSFRDKNRVTMTAKLDARQEKQLQGLLLELYQKAKNRPATLN